MKEYKIVIRIDEITNKIAFAIEKDKTNKVEHLLEFIALLDVLKAEQIKKLQNLFYAKFKK